MDNSNNINTSKEEQPTTESSVYAPLNNQPTQQVTLPQSPIQNKKFSLKIFIIVLIIISIIVLTVIILINTNHKKTNNSKTINQNTTISNTTIVEEKPLQSIKYTDETTQYINSNQDTKKNKLAFPLNVFEYNDSGKVIDCIDECYTIIATVDLAESGELTDDIKEQLYFGSTEVNLYRDSFGMADSIILYGNTSGMYDYGIRIRDCFSSSAEGNISSPSGKWNFISNGEGNTDFISYYSNVQFSSALKNKCVYATLIHNELENVRNQELTYLDSVNLFLAKNGDYLNVTDSDGKAHNLSEYTFVNDVVAKNLNTFNLSVVDSKDILSRMRSETEIKNHNDNNRYIKINNGGEPESSDVAESVIFNETNTLMIDKSNSWGDIRINTASSQGDYWLRLSPSPNSNNTTEFKQALQGVFIVNL